MVDVVVVHVGDHVDNGKQAQERTVGLVGLGDEVFSLPEMPVGAVGVEKAADDDRGIKAGGVEDGRGERRRGGLAVRARHRDARAQTHELGQHFRAGNDGNAAFPGGLHFGIVVGHGRGAHHHLRVAEVFGGMAEMDDGPEAAQTLHRGAVCEVGAVDRVAQVEEHFGNAAHA